MVVKQIAKKWYHQPGWALLIGVTAVLAAYAIGSRSLDTGSWQQYFMTLSLLILSINRLAHVAKIGVQLMYSGLRKA